MTSVNSPVATETSETKSDKELNFDKLRKKTEQTEAQLAQERQERLRLQQEVESIKSRALVHENSEEDDSSDEPYVDEKRLTKKLKKFEMDFDRKVEEKVEKRLQQERQKDNIYRLKSEFRDFDEVLNEQTAKKFADQHPELAQEILSLPDEFQRRKMAYQTIKGLGIHKKEEPKQSIQDTVNQKQKSPYFYQGGMGTPPSTMGGDFSEAGKKSAYDKMQALLKQRTAIR